MKSDAMASETYLDNKVRSNTREKVYSTVSYMKINAFEDVRDIFARLPNGVAILIPILEHFLGQRC